MQVASSLGPPVGRVDAMLDVCFDRGVWLDRGELEAIVRRGRSGIRRTSKVLDAKWQKVVSRVRWGLYGFCTADVSD